MEILYDMSIPDILGEKVFPKNRQEEIGQINESFFSDFFGHKEIKKTKTLNEHDICERLGVPGTFLKRAKGLPVKKDKENQIYIYETELIEWFYKNFLPKG